MKTNFKDILETNKKEYLNRLIDLLKINSILDESTKTTSMPFGKGINDCLNHFVSMAKNDGFSVEVDPGYAAHVEYGSDGKLIGILCHLDVVPVGDDWDHDPFDPVVKDGKVIARGAMDDKGPTMAAYLALKMIKDAKIPLKNKIRIILGTDEETGWRGIDHYFTKYPMPEIGFAPDADFPLIYGEKGIIHGFINGNYVDENDDLVYVKGGERFNIVLGKTKAATRTSHEEAFDAFLKENNLEGTFKEEDGLYCYEVLGIAAHAMEPEKGINSGTYLCKFLSNYTNNSLVHFIKDKLHLDHNMKNLNLYHEHEEMGMITCNMGILDSSNNTSKCSLDIRYPIGLDFDNFISILKAETKPYSLSLSDFSNKVPHYVDPKDPLVEGLYNIYVKHTNDFINKPKTIGGGTYSRALKKAVAFGMEMPGDETVAHQKNEYLKLDAFYQAILIYLDAILFLGDLDA